MSLQKTRTSDEPAIDKQFVVDATPYRTRVALLEDGRVAEIYIEHNSNKRLVGNIYKGKVRNVLPGMSAAFVDIAESKNAFLYIEDLAEDSERRFACEQLDRVPRKKLGKTIQPGQDIMIQIVKESFGTKGARASTQISLPGHKLVYLPNDSFIGISKRITDESERERLYSIIDCNRPQNGGVIVRTEAEGWSESSIKSELALLEHQWKLICSRYDNCKAPKLISSEESLIFRTIRDFMRSDVSRLIVNDKEAYEKLCGFASEMDAKLIPKVELREDAYNLFETMGIEQELNAALSRKVWLKSGGYIIIDQTEALVSIDVNTGKNVGKSSLQRTIADTNCEAAVEIARQLRLRNLSGIIVVDFIDMEDKHDMNRVVDTLKESLKRDRTPSVVFGMSDLGLVKITRKKLRHSLSACLQTTCPYCGGDGRVDTIETVALRVRERLLARIDDNGAVRVKVSAHPDVIKWLQEYAQIECECNPHISKLSITWNADRNLHIEEFSLV